MRKTFKFGRTENKVLIGVYVERSEHRADMRFRIVAALQHLRIVFQRLFIPLVGKRGIAEAERLGIFYGKFLFLADDADFPHGNGARRNRFVRLFHAGAELLFGDLFALDLRRPLSVETSKLHADVAALRLERRENLFDMR